MPPCTHYPVMLGALAFVACAPSLPSSSVDDAPETPGLPQSKQIRCSDVDPTTRPLLLEWPNEDRALLEAQKEKGIVLVRYEDCQMEVLRSCRAPGWYSYMPLTVKEDRETVSSRSELAAKLPLGFVALEGKVGAGSALDISMSIAGIYDANRWSVGQGELEGTGCDRATHAVAAITAGAFEMTASASRDAGGGLDVHGAGVGASTEQARERINRDGDAASCRKATTADSAPPAQCGALLRVELTPIAAGQAPATTAPSRIGELVEGAPATHLCKADDPIDCKEQCDLGHADSCARLSLMYFEGNNLPKDLAKAAQLSGLSCERGSLAGCNNHALALANGSGVPRDPAKAATLWQRACDQGDLPNSCSGIGVLLVRGDGVTANRERGLAYLERGCKGGYAWGCQMLKKLGDAPTP